jgi:hypothetical protein
VYVRQSLGFESPKFPDIVYKLSKALYRLKQASQLGMLGLRHFC